MDSEFKVLTNVNESNLRTPIIQNRFRKLTLQSPKQSNMQRKSPEPLPPPQSKLAIAHPPVSPYKSQTQTITNKLMLSTSSGNSTEQTNFINVETEPFTNPLRVESIENEKELPKNSGRKSDNSDLASQMEKLDVSKVSDDLFSQWSVSSKHSLPPNRIISNKENIENISQRISNLHMSDHGDLADTQPKTPSQGLAKNQLNNFIADTQPKTPSQGLAKNQLNNFVADTQPKTPSQGLAKNQLNNFVADTQPNSSPIVLSSDGEDNADGNNDSLLTEDESEDDSGDESVIEILSSDSSLEESDDHIPHNVSALNTQAQEITESVAQKLDHFFDNVPKLNNSHNMLGQMVGLNSSKNKLASSEIYVSETKASDKGDADENNIVLPLDENLDKSGESSSVKSASEVPSHAKDDHRQNETLNRSEEQTVDESGKTSSVDDESNNESVRSAINDRSASIHRNQSTDEKQVSVHEATKKIKTSAKNVITLNSPIINISAKVNINIQLSVFSSSTNSSETDGTSENADAVSSEESSKNNESVLSETSIASCGEFVALQCRKEGITAKNSQMFYHDSTNHKTTDVSDDDEPHSHSNEMSSESSVIESSLIQSQGDGTDEMQNEKSTTSGICDSTTISDDVTKESSIIADASTSTPKHENNVSLLPVDSSAEIDEIGEQILTEIYGDSWRTPQLLKKCLSTRKKCFTDVPKRNYSHGFSLFQREVMSELESTRITPSGSDKAENICQPLESSNEEVNGRNANQSSIIKRSCRKVIGNRILDYSDDDESDGKKSNADNSFEPVTSGGEESDSSSSPGTFVKPKTKRNKFVFLDLTCHEIVETEDHENPDASTEELEKVGERYLQSLQTETGVPTPAPAKNNVPSTTTKRKLFTPNYDEQIPFEEIKTPVGLPRDEKDKVIQLKTPIPSYLIPIPFRDRLKTTEPITSTSSKNAKKNQTPRTPVSSQVCGFLESLDAQLIPDEHCHPDAIQFRSNFKANRCKLVKRLMILFNAQVFDNKLKDVPVAWNNRLVTKAGRCHNCKSGTVRKSRIELSDKLLTSAERLRDTLIHELCHAATWIVDSASGHGKVWKYWTERANKRLSELPKIERCHDYDIPLRYTYKCSICGLKSQARSKSKKVENIRCSACHGPIEVFLNKNEKDGTVTLVQPKGASMFAKFVKENYKLSKERGVSHADVMKILSNNFDKLTVAEKSKYK